MKIEREVYEYPWSASLMKDSILSAHTEGWGLFDLAYNLRGFIIVSSIFDEAEILNFGVAKKYQSKGYGQKLLAYIMNHLAYKKINKIFLEVRITNHVAINIYKKYGFKQVSIRSKYYPKSNGQYEDALVLCVLLKEKNKV